MWELKSILFCSTLFYVSSNWKRHHLIIYFLKKSFYQKQSEISRQCNIQKCFKLCQVSFKLTEGYFLSKLITFEIVFIKVLFKNFFISWKNLVPCFRYSIFLNILILFILAIIQFCIFLPIPSTSNFVMSWWVLSRNVEFIFEYIFRLLNHLVMKLEQWTDLVMDKVFRNILLDWEEWVLNTAPF